MIKVGINGFGRIGRIFFRSAMNMSNIKVVAINDLADVKILAHLLKYDSIHGRLDANISVEGDDILKINGNEIKVFCKRNPAEIPWDEYGVDVVIESSGVFRSREGASLHFKRGVKYVVVSAPMDDPDIMILPYINEDKFDPNKHKIISMASCTTNALAPLIKVLLENFGIVKGHMTTIHAYTNDQRLLDAIHRDPRRARAAAVNIVPTTTGASKAIFYIYPELKGKLTAMSIRVPVVDGSLIDLNVEVEKNVTREEVNQVFKEAAEGDLSESLLYVDEPIVSSDIVGLPYLSIFDSLLTNVVGGNLVKVISWYDNEFGYSYHLAKLVSRIFKGVI